MKTQNPPHDSCPVGHEVTHTLAVQTWPEAHARPHAPQLARSVWRSRHVPEQLVCPAAQLTTHALAEHT